jgi:Ca2+-binding RTX toxin-like protein
MTQTTGYSGTIGELDGSPVPLSIAWAVSNILTVGTGEEYATIAAAVAAARDGNIIEVNAGTYINDFATISAHITLIGVGGMVNMVATEPPTNLKGIITVDASCTIENFSFSGAAIDAADGGNGAGIRYEGGNMVLDNDSFQNNQDGLLAFPVLGLPSNTIVLNNDTFNENGSGTGSTHNAYIGAVDSLTVTNCIFEQANVGHELKSRALVNTITNNSFYDGPTADPSYDIDLPNGGVDVVENNTIEKGPLAQNQNMIHFGGESVPYAGSSLLVQGNTFEGDKTDAVGVLNQTAYSVTITGNTFDNMTASQIANGPATESNNVNGDGVAFSNTTLVGVIPGSTQIYTDALPHDIVLNGTGINAVEGGAGALIVTAIAGHIVAIGGSGGMNYTEVAPSGGNQITTAANSYNTIVLSGQDTLDSEGNDIITAGAGNITATVNGDALVYDGTGSNGWSVNGTANFIANNSNESISLGAAGDLTITGTEANLQITSNGGYASFNVSQGGGQQQATIAGGSYSLRIYSGQMQIMTSASRPGATMTFVAGTETVTSAGSDTIYAGGSNAIIIVEAAAQVYAGTGQLSVFGRSDSAGASVYAANGTVTLNGDTGNITYYGGSQANTVNSILSSDIFIGGSGLMTIIGGSRETITGGSGGVVYTSTGGGANSITTQAGSTNVLSLSGQDVIHSQGNDTITTVGAMSGTVTGNATVNGGGGGNINLVLAGTDTFIGNGHDILTATAGANLTIEDSGFSTVSENGATVSYFEEGSSGPLANVTVLGGSASIHSDYTSGLSVTTVAGQSTKVVMGSGQQSVHTLSNDQIYGGSGADTVTVDNGGASIWCGSGNTTLAVHDWNSADKTTVYGGSGSLSAVGGTDALTFIGGSGSAVINGEYGSMYIVGGSGNLTAFGGCAATTFIGGSGNATVSLTSCGGSVQFGSGSTTITEAGWGSVDTYSFLAGQAASTDLINNFRVGTDKIILNGVSVASETVSGGSASIIFSDNSHLTLAGVTNLSHLTFS